MEHRSRHHELSNSSLADAHTSSALPPLHPSRPTTPKTSNGATPFPWSGLSRPLSDIRELSEPSMMDNITRKPSVASGHHRCPSKSSSVLHKPSVRHVGSNKSVKLAFEASNVRNEPQDNGSSSYSTTPEQPNIYNVSSSNVPRRSSSQKRTPGLEIASDKDVMSSNPAPPVPTLSHTSGHVPHYREPGYSPVKGTNVHTDGLPADAEAHPPARTFVRSPRPTDILVFPCYKHPRLKVDLQVSAPLFVGGGSIEGHVRLTVDGNNHLKHRRSLSIGTVSVDLLGFEDVTGNRREIFLALGSNIIDSDRPPPDRMVEATHPFFDDGDFWPLASSFTSLQFVISLPLQPGPPPFRSRHACIRYLLAVTAALRDTGKIYHVRTSQDIYVLPTYDPEKALTSLRSPLTSCDQQTWRRGAVHETIEIEASLHRQVWVSGGSIFVSVHISNRCRKPVKRLELSLERDILCYKHAAASTMEKSARHARIFESNEQSMLVKSVFKPGVVGWDGVDPHSTDERTYQLALPRGHGTVRCGKYFEVRYFLNVAVFISSSKNASVQLPIILIHINSLDIVPNSIVQVATAIEEKRADVQRKRSRHKQLQGDHRRQRSVSSSLGTDLRRRPSYGQGRAFAAPRQQSLDRQREQQADIDELRHVIDSSPRKTTCPPTRMPSVKKPSSSLSLYSLAHRKPSSDCLFASGALAFDGTPSAFDPKIRKPKEHNDTPTLLNRLRSMRSFDTFRNRGVRGKDTSKEQNHNFMASHCASQQSIREVAPQITRSDMVDGAVDSTSVPPAVTAEQTNSPMEVQEKLGSTRFDLKTVSRKASGGLKGRGLGWLEQRRKDRDKEKERTGWI